MLRPGVGVGEIPQATACLAWKVHPRGTDEMRVRDALGPIFVDTDFADGEFAQMYSALGQPGLSPALLTMVMILQFRHRLSDRDAAQAVCDRISWKYALGLDLEFTGFDASVLSEFRARLVDNVCVDALLDLMLDRLKDAGLVKAGGKQRTDSTHVIACVRQLNRIETVGEGLRAALEAIAAISRRSLCRCWPKAGTNATAAKWKPARLLSRKNASADALATQIGADGQALLSKIDADPVAAWMNTLPEVTVLRILWDQQYQATPSGRLRFKDAARLPPAADRLHSPHDREARYSTKGKGGDDDLQWVGFKSHLTETCDEDLPNLVTDAHTTPATEPHVVATTTIQDKLIARGLAQASICATPATPAHPTSPPPPGGISP